MSPASSAALTPRPDNEAARLRAVQDLCILDSGPEPEFEAIARVAARLFGTPMAMVAIMDDKRLWLKAQIGLNVTELARQDAMCALTLAQPVAHHQPLVIEDLWQDPRSLHNPFVTGPGQWRFYAGAPLFDALGHGLGTVAVMDTEPRAFNMAQRHALSDLALLAGKALEGRAHGLKLAQTDHRDPLTGLSSRSQFDLALDIELRHAMRTGEAFTVLCIAVDGLQTVVDGFGADAKEQVLRHLSNQLAPQVRIGDVLARLHDDEFAVVMRHGDQSSAEMLVSRMVAAAKAPITLQSGDTVGVGLSVGIAAYNDGVENAAALLSQAHQALHHAKQKNEERWSFFRPLREKPELRLIQSD